MGRKGKVSFEEKIRSIDAYLSGEKSAAEICSKFGIHNQSFRAWIRKYNMSGKNGVAVKHKNRMYSAEIKFRAVRDYVNGNGSLEHICSKYKISAISGLQQWIKKYNSHKEFKSHSNESVKLI